LGLLLLGRDSGSGGDFASVGAYEAISEAAIFLMRWRQALFLVDRYQC